MTVSHATDPSEAYEIRRYQPGDASDVVALYESIWGSTVDETWLHHRFIANPFVDESTMIVADSGDRVVGARPFVAVPIRANGEQRLGLLLNDLMVHPAHRRRGLFTRMTTRLIEEAAADAALTLNFANELSAPGYRTMGFTEIGTGLHKHVRIQRPGHFLTDRIGGVAGRLAGSIADVGTAAIHLAEDVTRSHPDVEVERYRGIPADRIAETDTGPIDGIHTARTVPLYRWLAADPRWRYRTYVARDGDTAAALVVKEHVDDTDTCLIADARPLGSATDTLAGVVATALADARDAPLVSVTGPVVYEHLLSSGLLRRFGFHSSTTPLFDRLTADHDTVFVNTLDADTTIGGLDVCDPGNWQARVDGG